MGRTLKFILLHFNPTQAHTQDLNVLFEHGNCSLDKDILESLRRERTKSLGHKTQPAHFGA